MKIDSLALGTLIQDDLGKMLWTSAERGDPELRQRVQHWRNGQAMGQGEPECGEFLATQRVL